MKVFDAFMAKWYKTPPTSRGSRPGDVARFLVRIYFLSDDWNHGIPNRDIWQMFHCEIANCGLVVPPKGKVAFTCFGRDGYFEFLGISTVDDFPILDGDNHENL